MSGGCCRCQTFLIWTQLVLGVSITGLCVYLHLFVDAITLRDKPFWAGIPLLLAGLFSTSFIGSYKQRHRLGSSCAFFFKVSSIVMAIIAIFTCVTSLVFLFLHVYKMLTFSHCQHLTNGCLCFNHMTQQAANGTTTLVEYNEVEGEGGESWGHLYSPVRDCNQVFCEIKIHLCTLGSLCLAGSVAATSFILTVWTSIYGATSSPPPPME